MKQRKLLYKKSKIKLTSDVSIKNLEKVLECSFSNKDLLIEALTHDSWKQQGSSISKDQTYQRLEFLGDSVVNFITTEFLFNKYKKDNEGKLSKKKSALVSGFAFAICAKELNLHKYMQAMPNVDTENPALLADVFEAVLGAVYLDKGIDICRKILQKHLFSKESDILRSEVFINPKTLLNEKSQSLFLNVPVYEITDEWGPPHERNYSVNVKISGKVFGRGEGRSKKEAEQIAARKAIEVIESSNNLPSTN